MTPESGYSCIKFSQRSLRIPSNRLESTGNVVWRGFPAGLGDEGGIKPAALGVHTSGQRNY
jgi:hypothetical protein